MRVPDASDGSSSYAKPPFGTQARVGGNKVSTSC